MAEQTNNASTNDDLQTPINFNDVSLETLQKSFNDTYKVSKGSASQIVIGFKLMASRLLGPQNEYQQELYPQLKQMCTSIFDKYNEMFLMNFQGNVDRQVYGANLNGNRNSGSLYRSIPSGVNRNLTYNYAQFGQLVRVLSGRLRFIVNRDVGSVQRYKDSLDEASSYQTLQTKSNEFLKYLDTVSSNWDTFVKATRVKYSVEEPKERQERQERQFNQRGQTSRYEGRHEGRHEGRYEGRHEGGYEGRYEGGYEGRYEGKQGDARHQKNFSVGRTEKSAHSLPAETPSQYTQQLRQRQNRPLHHTESQEGDWQKVKNTRN